MADLRKKVSALASKAMKQIGTLAMDIVVTSNNVASFDFSTAEPVSGLTSQKTLKMVLLKRRRRSSESGTNTETLEFLLVDKDADLTTYDTLEYGGFVYSIIKPLVSDGFTLQLMATREV